MKEESGFQTNLSLPQNHQKGLDGLQTDELYLQSLFSECGRGRRFAWIADSLVYLT